MSRPEPGFAAAAAAAESAFLVVLLLPVCISLRLISIAGASRRQRAIISLPDGTKSTEMTEHELAGNHKANASVSTVAPPRACSAHVRSAAATAAAAAGRARTVPDHTRRPFISLLDRAAVAVNRGVSVIFRTYWLVGRTAAPSRERPGREGTGGCLD